MGRNTHGFCVFATIHRRRNRQAPGGEIRRRHAAIVTAAFSKGALLRHLAILEATPTTNADTYTRVGAELRRYGAVERPAGTAQPRRTLAQGTQFSRDPRVRGWTLNRAQGRCELCSQPAPFIDKDQEPYLESHHITMLADDGADTPENTAALCANCHRELHIGIDRDARTKELRAIVAAKEASMEAPLPLAMEWRVLP